MSIKKNFTLAGLAAAAMLLPRVCCAQGSFTFSNYAPPAGIDAPVFDAFGNRLAGSNYVAILYGGIAPGSLRLASREQSESSMAPVAFWEGVLAGYFGRGGWVEITGLPPGQFGWVQVRAWDARLGTSYEDVVRLGLGGYGESKLLFLQSGGGGSGVPALPATLDGLQSFNLRPLMLMRSIRQQGDQVVIEWNPGFKRYQLQQTLALGQPWQNVGNVTTNLSYTTSISATNNLFFRVIGLLE